MLRALHHDTLKACNCRWGGDLDLWCLVSSDEAAIGLAQKVLQTWDDSGLCDISFDYQHPTGSPQPSYRDGKLKVRSETLALKVCLCIHGVTKQHALPLKVDIILKGYKTIFSTLSRFDMDCCRFAYDGANFWTTYSGLTALTTGINHFGIDDAKTTDAQRTLPRMLKYVGRGFATRFVGMTADELTSTDHTKRNKLVRGFLLAHKAMGEHDVLTDRILDNTIDRCLPVIYGLCGSAKVDTFRQWFYPEIKAAD